MSSISVAPSDSVSQVPSATTAATTVTVSHRGGRGKGRGRGRGGGNQPRGGSNRGPPGSPYPASSEFQTIERKPVPQHLSTIPSPTQDDPLFIDEFAISGADRLRPTKQFPRISLDHQGFLPLVRSCYAVIITSDHNFQKSIPEPLFMYYCTMALWYRYFFLASSYGDLSVDTNTLERMRSVQWFLPDPIKRYLDGIGTVRAPDGQLIRVATDYISELDGILEPDLTNFRGTYGRADANNHYLYAAMPSPFVAVFNVCAWIEASEQRGTAWVNELPDNLRPDPGNNHSWRTSGNVTGFVRAGRTLSNKQRAVLKSNGFDASVVNGAQFDEMIGSKVLFTAPAVVFTSSEVRNIVGFKVSNFENTSPTGSMAILPWVEPDHLREKPLEADVTQWNLEVKSSYDLASQISSASLFASYRLDRTETRSARGQRNFPFQRFNDNAEPAQPVQEYYNHINDAFTGHDAARVNRHYFDAGPINRRDILQSVITNFIHK